MRNRFLWLASRAAAAAAALALAACAATPPPIVHQPMTSRAPEPRPTEGNGAIFQVAANGPAYRPLFEDRRARGVGDTLVILISEKTAANKNSETKVDKSGSSTYSVTGIAGLPGATFNGSNLGANSAHAFDGKGNSTANNDFTGTITVTVTDIYPNGNMLVSGEKQIAMPQGNEFVRFSGVVDPRSISGSNSVASTQVADARIEYRSNGVIDEAQVMGWLARFFMTFLPF